MEKAVQSRPLSSLFDAVATRRRDRVALIDRGVSLTFWELADAVAEARAAFAANGVGPGVLLAVVISPGATQTTAVLAGLSAGALVCALDPAVPGKVLGAQLDACGAVAVAVAEDVPGGSQKLSAAGAKFHLATETARSMQLLIAPDKDSAPGFLPSGLLTLTSGTSGEPKLVVQSQWGLLRAIRLTQLLRLEALGDTSEAMADTNAAVFAQTMGAMEAEPLGLAFLGGMPPTTIAGVTVLFQALLSGECAVLEPFFEPARFLDLVESCRVTNLGLSPFMGQRLLRAAHASPRHTDSLLLVGLGGGPAPADLVADLEAELGCTVTVGYGSTELGGLALMARVTDPIETRSTTVGRPLTGILAKIVDRHGQPRRDGEIGELVIRSPSCCVGYLSPDGRVQPAVGRSGWYRTGDRALRRRDGNFEVCGRLTDLVLRGGRKLDPTLIEQVLERHPAVARAGVVGVPSRLLGEEDTLAFIVQSGTAAVSPVELRRWCREELGEPYVPRRITTLADLPLTVDGAIRRQELRQLGLSVIERG